MSGQRRKFRRDQSIPVESGHVAIAVCRLESHVPGRRRCRAVAEFVIGLADDIGAKELACYGNMQAGAKVSGTVKRYRPDPL